MKGVEDSKIISFKKEEALKVVKNYILHLPIPVVMEENGYVKLGNYKFNVIPVLKYIDCLNDLKIYIYYKFWKVYPKVQLAHVLPESVLDINPTNCVVDRIYLLEDIFRVNINSFEKILVFISKKPLSEFLVELRDQKKDSSYKTINPDNSFFIRVKSLSQISRIDPRFFLRYYLKVNDKEPIFYENENKIVLYPYIIKYTKDFNFEKFLREELKDERKITIKWN